MDKNINSKNSLVSRNSAITIVALSITVILLMILVGVSAKIIVDEDLIQSSENAASNYTKKQAKDLLLMHLEDLKIKSVENNMQNDGRITILKEIDGKSNNEITVDLVSGEVNITTYNGVSAVKVQVKGYTFYVNGDLEII